MLDLDAFIAKNVRRLSPEQAKSTPYVFRGAALESQTYEGPEWVLSGPYECVAGQTMLYDPVERAAHPIKWYCDHRVAPHVLTLYGTAQACIPFKKGYAGLYRVTLKNGCSFLATKRHRVLTPYGWRCVGEVSVCDFLLGYGECRQASNEAPDREVSLRDARRYAQITASSQWRCLTYHHRHDEQLRWEEGSGPVFAPSLGGVREHSRDDCSVDAKELLRARIHPYRLFDHLSSVHYVARNDYCCEMVNGECCGARYIHVHGDGTFPPLLQCSEAFHDSQAFDEAEHHFVRKPISLPYSYPPDGEYTLFISPVANIEYVGYGDFFDIAVPGYGHYFAEGVCHHNTGKTIAALSHLHGLLERYPKARGLMVRKTYQSLINSAVVTYEKKILGDNSSVHKFGGEKPEFYDYHNGARLVLGGMDNPDKFLSSEFDFIYVNQAEEETLDDWEKLVSRATGRAGNAPFSQVFGDCNPSHPLHWLLHRKRLKVFYSRHEDNPLLYDENGKLTEQGERTIAALDALTGLRYKRGRLGLWVAAEGQVYEDFDPALHLIDPFTIPDDWRRIRAIDFGYTNPFCCGWYAMDLDGRMYLYRELYQTQSLVEDLAAEIIRLSEGERIEATVADHDAEDRATLERHGVPTIPANKAISVGLQTVSVRLRKAGDGKPRLFIFRDILVQRDMQLVAKFKPLSTLDEFPVYVWPQAKDGKPIKELPVDDNNHGLDQLRYAVMYNDSPRPQWGAFIA